MATIGAVITEFRANAGQFFQETGKVITTTEKVGRTAGVSQRQMANYATQGLGAVIPAAEGAEHAIATVITSLLKMGGVLALLGKGAILTGGFITGVMIGQRLKDEIANWLEWGETINQTTERLKEETESQKKFATERERSVRLLINLEKERRAAASEAQVERLTGRPLDIAAEEREAALEQETLKRQIRERDILAATIGFEERRRKALIESAQITANERLKIERKYVNDVAKANQEALDAAKKTYVDQTNALLEQLQKRVQMREQIECQAGAAAQRQGLGDIFAPFRQADETKRDMQKVAEGFALLLADGQRWADLAPEIFRVAAEFERRGFFGLLSAIEESRRRFEIMRIGTQQLVADFDSVRLAVERFPASLTAADPAVQGFIQKLQAMEFQANQTAVAIQQLANVVAAGGVPPVSAQPLEVAPP
jgi:hypothetical protein